MSDQGKSYDHCYRGRVVWITGASSGIGEGLARELGRAGARLILSARNVERLEQIAAELPDCKVLPLDLAQPESLAAKAQEALALYGGLDMIVHNGGIGQRSYAADTPLEQTRLIMEVDFFSTVILTKELLPALRAAHGKILVISSLMGKFGGPGRSAYAAAKHALHGYYEALRAEELNIQITLVTPGYIRTNISLHALRADGSEHGKLDPGQEKGMPTDVCAVKILRGAAKGKNEILVGGWECAGAHLKRWAPGFLTRILRGRSIE